MDGSVVYVWQTNVLSLGQSQRQRRIMARQRRALRRFSQGGREGRDGTRVALCERKLGGDWEMTGSETNGSSHGDGPRPGC